MMRSVRGPLNASRAMSLPGGRRWSLILLLLAAMLLSLTVVPAAVAVVMIIMFFLGFILDTFEIIFIVIPITAPVLLMLDVDPIWLGVLVGVNLQTSFLTPPFGFALFYLRGVAPKEVTTGHIYRGVIPFVIIQVVGLLLLAVFPGVVTIVPALLGSG